MSEAIDSADAAMQLLVEAAASAIPQMLTRQQDHHVLGSGAHHSVIPTTQSDAVPQHLGEVAVQSIAQKLTDDITIS